MLKLGSVNVDIDLRALDFCDREKVMGHTQYEPQDTGSIEHRVKGQIRHAQSIQRIGKF
jgi:hypothetical protein